LDLPPHLENHFPHKNNRKFEHTGIVKNLVNPESEMNKYGNDFLHKGYRNPD